MKRLVSTTAISHEEWLAYRKTGLTGTDAGAITGMNPYSSPFQVYQNKISEENELLDNESMRQGRDLEDYVAERFMEETGKKVRKANAIFYNEEHSIMLADFDRLVIGESAGLECKTVSPYSSDKWKDGKIPLHYQMQCQHYLAVSGLDRWYLAALIFGTEFIIHKIERDEELIQNLIVIEERFWKEHVLARVIPEPDGSDNYSDMLSALYVPKQEKKISLYGMEAELQRRRELEELISKLEKEKTAIDQKIKLEMQDAESAITNEFYISWKGVESKRLDTKKLKSEHPEVYHQYCNTSYTRKFMIKKAA